MSDPKIIPFQVRSAPTSDTLEALCDLAGLLEDVDIASENIAIVTADARSEGCREFVHGQVRQAIDYINSWIEEEQAKLGVKQ